MDASMQVRRVHIFDSLLFTFCYILLPLCTVGAGIFFSKDSYLVGVVLVLFAVFVNFMARDVAQYLKSGKAPRGFVFFKRMNDFFSDVVRITDDSFEGRYPFFVRALITSVVIPLLLVLRYGYIPAIAVLVAFVLS